MVLANNLCVLNCVLVFNIDYINNTGVYSLYISGATSSMIRDIPLLHQKEQTFLTMVTTEENYLEGKQALEIVDLGYTQTNLYNNPSLFSDIKVKIGESGEVLHLRRAVLALHSEYFKQLLLQEREALSKPGAVLELRAQPELQTEFEIFFKFLYTGQVTVNKYSVFRYLFLAYAVLCDDLKQTCINYLRRQLGIKLQEGTLQLQVISSHGPKNIPHRFSESFTITEPQKVTYLYTASEILYLWEVTSDSTLVALCTLWFAAHLKPRIQADNHYNSNNETFIIKTEKFDLSERLGYNQVCAILSFNIQPCSEHGLFMFAIKWLEKHPEEEQADCLLCKIRYAYMTPEQRHKILHDRKWEVVQNYLRDNPTLVLHIIHRSFWHDHVILETTESKTNLGELYPEYKKEIYKPRYYVFQDIRETTPQIKKNQLSMHNFCHIDNKMPFVRLNCSDSNGYGCLVVRVSMKACINCRK